MGSLFGQTDSLTRTRGPGNGLHKTSEKAKVSRHRTGDKNYLRETFTSLDAYAFILTTSVFLLLRYTYTNLLKNTCTVQVIPSVKCCPDFITE